MLRLEYGRMLQDGLDGEHGLSRPSWPNWAPLPGYPSRRSAPARRRESTASFPWPSRARRSAASRSLPSGVGQAFDHVLVLGIGGSALGARALLTRCGHRRGTSWMTRDGISIPGSRSSTTWTRSQRARRAQSHRSAPGPGERGQQVGRHGGDDGAVPRGPGLAGGGARSSRVAPPGLHHRSAARHPARHRAPRGDRGGRRAAGGGRPVQRAVAGGPAAGGAGGHRHRGAP